MHSSGLDVGRQLGYNPGKSGGSIGDIVSAINHSFPDVRRDLTQVGGYFSRRLRELRSYKSSEEDLAQSLEYFDKNSSHAVGNAALAVKYTVSVMTFGLPQTIGYLFNKVMDGGIHYRKGDWSRFNLDIAKICVTGAVILGQVKLMQEFYSRFV